MKQKAYTFSVLTALWLVFVGCAEERPPVDRVQPGAITKAQLAGEWFYQRTLVDVPAAETVTATGFGSDVVRVVWDVQEDMIYARRTTELIKNADGKQAAGDAYEGEVVAAFRVERHSLRP